MGSPTPAQIIGGNIVTTESLQVPVAANDISLVDDLRAHLPYNSEFLTAYSAAFLKSATTDNEASAINARHVLATAATRLARFAAQRVNGAPLVGVTNDMAADNSRIITTICALNDDMPFLVDSLMRFLGEQGCESIRLFHPVLNVARDEQGNLSPNGSVYKAESWIYLELDQQLGTEAVKSFEHHIFNLYSSVNEVVADKGLMFNLIRDSATQLAQAGAAEEAAFVQQMADGLFVVMAVRDTGDHAVKASGLYTHANFYAFADEKDQPNLALLPEGSVMTALKADSRSVVHRRVPFDVVVVRRYYNGVAVGERHFIGLLTSTAHSMPIDNVPYLRSKTRAVLQRAAFVSGGHDDKNLRHVLSTFPRDELLQTDADTLFDQAMGMARFETRPRIRAFYRLDARGTAASVMVLLPRDTLGSDVRDKIRHLLQTLCNATVTEVGSQVGETGSLTVRYALSLAQKGGTGITEAALEDKIVQLTVSPDARLRAALVTPEAADIAGSFNQYREAFPDDYWGRHDDALTTDIRAINGLSAQNPATLKIIDRGTSLQLRLYNQKNALPLADCLPIFDNFGLRILSEQSYCIARGTQPTHLQVLEASCATPTAAGFAALAEQAFAQVLQGDIENDALNALTLSAALPSASVIILRAVVRYLRQARATFDRTNAEIALRRNPLVAKALVAYFDARFNPTHTQRDAIQAEQRAALDALLAQVAAPEDDRVLRAIDAFFGAILRTNFYQTTANNTAKSYVSFKIDPARLSFLPQPVPYREIWVCSPRIEGVHLRFAPVARGGLRWSDRREDFRTEVLGLVKAQRVKNAVIVPSGSKGGFYPKALDGLTGDARMQEAIACYQIFLRGMLDITDNILGDAVVPPQNTVRYDNDDPYLVVAADKGTATFSDIANGLAAEYAFWLGDAFASGGSQGYDHKKMGITARGAWVAVQRHFREMGTDIQTTPFKVMGVGDMSGDVFGNGMLLSEKIQLVAAFDHRDIFIDPTPNCDTSFAERQRLFALPRSSWQDYNKDLISQGGGIFSRRAKTIDLTPQIKELTGLTQNSVAPEVLMRALLQAPVDLLWFGGIGTYVKAASETHADAGDKASDALRIDAEEIRARVVGEGANLGLTQRGRIAFARKGGCINTDAVDNSAGVDCSDHEVNIKIALRYVQAQNKMTEDERNALLLAMTDTVSELVLRTNRDQTLALSAEEAVAARNLEKHRTFMRALEQDNALSRSVEFLPDERALDVLKASNQGLTRPELAVLLAYAKLDATEQFLAAHATNDPFLMHLVAEYMPPELTQRFGEALDNHRLKAEIIATVLANRLVHEAGLTFFRNALDDGCDVKRLLQTFAALRVVFHQVIPDTMLYDHRNFTDAAAHNRFFLRYRSAMRRELLRALHSSTPISPADFVQTYATATQSAVVALGQNLRGALADEYNTILAETSADCQNAAAAQALAAFGLPISPLSMADAAVRQGITAKQAVGYISTLLNTVQLDAPLLRVVDIDTAGDSFERSAVRRALADTELTLETIAAHVQRYGVDESQLLQAFAPARVAELRRFADRLAAVPVLGSPHLQLLNHAIAALIETTV